MTEKPTCKLVNTNGNIFLLLGRVTTCLKKAGQRDKATEVAQKVLACGSYDEALKVFFEYVDIQ